MKKILLFAGLLAANFAGAQAFTGKGDAKLNIGANIQDGGAGITGTVDLGIGENLSYGFSATYLLGVDEVLGEKPDFADRADIKARLNANIGNVIGISEQFDLYPGLDLGLRNFGAHVGARYFFTNGFGVYSEAGFPIARYDTDPVGFDYLNNQFVFQVGASFNF
ncbi:DUF6646 family protein [Flavobacterium rhizosphaerae]|uniref:DUF6646 family protein n=1 Tax=Flavobacterium rhizosphaerae TaxID=3163298 RepID=A0ABW8YTJ0_9FLAO